MFGKIEKIIMLVLAIATFIIVNNIIKQQIKISVGSAIINNQEALFKYDNYYELSLRRVKSIKKKTLIIYFDSKDSVLLKNKIKVDELRQFVDSSEVKIVDNRIHIEFGELTKDDPLKFSIVSNKPLDTIKHLFLENISWCTAKVIDKSQNFRYYFLVGLAIVCFIFFLLFVLKIIRFKKKGVDSSTFAGSFKIETPSFSSIHSSTRERLKKSKH